MRILPLYLVLVSLLAAVCFCAKFGNGANAAEMGIALVVNDDAISVADLNDRLELVISSSRLPNTQKTRDQLAPQIVSALVEEQLKLQEAARLEIEVSQGEIDNGFATIAQQNGMELDQFKKVLSKTGVNFMTMENQIRSQISWSKVVQQSLRSKVSISENDVKNVRERLEASAGKTEYLAAEIVLSVNNPQEEAKISALARDLVTQMRAEKASFFRLAQQFSSAPGAPQGGDLGWIQAGQLNADLDDTLVNMQKGEVSDPIRTIGGYHILSLRDSRVVSGDTIPNDQQIRNSLGMERMERLQRRRLMDLKSSAFIENRLGR